MKNLKSYMPVQLCKDEHMAKIQEMFDIMKELNGNISVVQTFLHTILFLKKKDVSLFVKVQDDKTVYICKNKIFDNLNDAITEFLI